jgi:hypothetical protein
MPRFGSRMTDSKAHVLIHCIKLQDEKRGQKKKRLIVFSSFRLLHQVSNCIVQLFQDLFLLQSKDTTISKKIQNKTLQTSSHFIEPKTKIETLLEDLVPQYLGRYKSVFQIKTFIIKSTRQCLPPEDIL